MTDHAAYWSRLEAAAREEAAALGDSKLNPPALIARRTTQAPEPGVKLQ